jgi:hypothetical protein
VVQGSGSARATATRFEANGGGSTLNHIAKADLVIGQKPGQTHAKGRRTTPFPLMMGL